MRGILLPVSLLALSACVIPELKSPDVTLPPEGEQSQQDGNPPPYSPTFEGERPQGVAVGSPGQVESEQLAAGNTDPSLQRNRQTATFDNLDGSGTQSLTLTPPSAKDPKEVRVALLLPLGSGDGGLRSDARALKDSAEMALFDWRNEHITLLPLDTKGTREGAEAAANKAVEQGAHIILGPLLRTSVRAVAPIARDADIPVLSFSNDPTIGGDNVYSLGLSPTYEVDRLVIHAISQGITRFALLTPESAYGHLVARAAQQSILRHGGEITARPASIQQPRIIPNR